MYLVVFSTLAHALRHGAPDESQQRSSRSGIVVKVPNMLTLVCCVQVPILYVRISWYIFLCRGQSQQELNVRMAKYHYSGWVACIRFNIESEGPRSELNGLPERT